MSKKLGARKERQIRREKARSASERQARARSEALAQARSFILSVLVPLNDEGRDPETRAQAQAQRGVLPLKGLQWSSEDRKQVDADLTAGVAMTKRLLQKWEQRVVDALLSEVRVVGSEYVSSPDGEPKLEPRLQTGPAKALAALHLAKARHLLHSVGGTEDPFTRRVKQCANPVCQKWFFDAERGTRKWCCVPCGNAHRQLKLSKNYKSRLKAGEYARRRSPCSRPDCEG